MIQALTVKNKLTLLAMLLVVAALVAMVFGLYGNMTAQAQVEEEVKDKRTMTVSGQAKVSVAPDFATINLGVITEDKDAMVAQKANSAAMDKVVASLKASGVKAEDMKTVTYSIQPRYDYDEKTRESRITGYTVSNSVNVTVRDLTKTGSIIDAAAQSGVNISSNISFGLSNYEDFYNEALEKAVLAAKKKADTMAGALGVKLIAPISVNEGGGYSPLSNYAVYDMKVTSASQTPIEAGSLEITANVSIVYEY